MALHSQLPLYKTVFDLTKSALIFKRNMPRDFKKSMGERIEDELISISILVFRANVARDAGKRARYLEDLLERKEVTDYLLRLAVDLQAISPKQFGGMIRLLDSIGKQTNGWRKHTAASPAT